MVADRSVGPVAMQTLYYYPLHMVGQQADSREKSDLRTLRTQPTAE